MLKNETKAVELAERAADMGSAEGYRQLGMYYWNGTGVEKDISMSAKMFLEAAKLGHVACMDHVGWLYI